MPSPFPRGPIPLSRPNARAEAPQPGKEKNPEQVKSTKKDATLKNGFLVNQPEEALRLAQKEKRPLLIDFFGIWCPPCNELDQEVF